MPESRRRLRDQDPRPDALAVVDPAEQYAMLERIVVGGDLAALTPKERLRYYRELCASLKLNPLTRPFQYLYLDSRLTLYATKDCTEQLRVLHGVSVTRLEVSSPRDALGDEHIYRVIAYGKNAAGREDVATGVVWIKGLAGAVLANMQMKAETKAKRRLTLSLCGLGALDESEVADVVIGGEVDVDPDTGEITTDLQRDALAATEPGPTPDEKTDAEEREKEHVLGSVKVGFTELRLVGAERDAVWKEFCGEAEPLTTVATLDALNALRDHLRAKYLAARKAAP